MNVVTVGAAGELTTTPTNKVALKQDHVVMECATNSTPNKITWIHDSAPITTIPCTTTVEGYSVTNNSAAGDCYLQVDGSTTTDRLSGPYACNDDMPPGNPISAEAVLIVIGK